MPAFQCNSHSTKCVISYSSRFQVFNTHLGLGCLRFLTIQDCTYQQLTMDQAAECGGRFTQEDFMKSIEGPYKKAFSTTNMIKAFEVTGTWPVDCSCITSDKIAPAMALPSCSKATIPQSSPVMNFLKTYCMFPATLGNNAPNLASTTSIDNPEGLNGTKI